MFMMLLGLVIFIGTHLVSTRPALRASLVGQVGEGPYKGFYSLLALSGLLLTGYGYGLWRAAGPAVLWTPPYQLRHLTMGLMLIAAVCLVAAYVPSHIKAWLKHPMLVGVKVWALAHFLVKGDAASMTLFAVVLAWAVYDRISVKRRGLPLPVAPSGWTGDLAAVAGGIVLYLVLVFVFHPYVVGVPVMG